MEYGENTPSFFRFEDLRVYQKALNYYVWALDKTDAHNKSDVSLMERLFIEDALNISTNIAKGSTRSKSAFVCNLKDAKMMVKKCVIHSSAAEKIGHIDSDTANTSRDMLMELTKMIGALITSLQRDPLHSPSPIHKPTSNTNTNEDR